MPWSPTGRPRTREADREAVTTIGLDIAKSVFQVHGVDAAGQVVVRRQLKRRSVLAFFQKLPSCLVGLEACASAHHWARELTALGHTVKLMPPAYVKPYVKRQKNDAADAEAICEAVTRPSMRFVPKQHSSGGKDKLGGISKQGDRYLRSLFTAGALAVIRYAKIHGTTHRPWLTALLARRPTKVAAIALANKIARVAWALMARGERYREPAAQAA
jgi:transposase